MSRNIWIGIVVVIVLAAGAWWYLNQSSAPSVSESTQVPTQQNAQQKTNVGTQSAPATPMQQTSSSNVPSGWSTNTNSQYGFSISHPTSVTVAPAADSLVFSASVQGPSDAVGAISGSLQISTTGNSNAPDCLSAPVSSEAQVSDSQNVTVNGLPLFSYKVDDVFAGGSSTGYHYKVLRGTTCFDISYYAQYAGGLAGSALNVSGEESKINATFLAMVQTFRFTN